MAERAFTRLFRCRSCDVYGTDLRCWCCGTDDLDRLEDEDTPQIATGGLGD
jgi:hypothetical protein